MTQQLAFDFLDTDNYNVHNFIVWSGNIEAFCLLTKMDEDSNPPGQLIFLAGVPKSGKTHMGYIWQQLHRAQVVELSKFFQLSCESFIQQIGVNIGKFGCYLLDNFPVDLEDDKFFYLLNTILSNNASALLISRQDLRNKPIKLEDLTSRLKSGIFLQLEEISQDIKPMLIHKLFADRQITINGDILRYLNGYLPESHEKIYNCVDNICRKIFAGNQRLSLTLVKTLLSLTKE
jgi:chromosomal replication initiation ATPase DnaA